MNRVTVQLEGMMCGMCESHVKDAIRNGIPDAREVSASHTTNIATFTMENDMPKGMIQHELKSAIEPTGYRVLSVTTEAGVRPAKKKGLFGLGRKK